MSELSKLQDVPRRTAARPSPTTAPADPPRSESFEDELARVHRTPRGVEQYGVEVIPKRERTVRWPDFFMIWLAFVINPLSYTLPGQAVAQGHFSFLVAVLSQVLAWGLGFVGMALAAHWGVKYGVSGQVALRSLFGIRGGKWVASLGRFALSGYWFAAQTLAASMLVQPVLGAIGIHVGVIAIAVFFTVLQSILGILGYRSVLLSNRVRLPAMLLLIVAMVIIFATLGGPHYAFHSVVSHTPASGALPWIGIALWAAPALAGNMGVYSDSSDFSRYVYSKRDMWLGILPGVMLGAALPAIISAWAATATGQWNPFQAVSDLHPSTFVLVLMLLALILDTVAINLLNLYSGGMSLVNIVPKLGRYWATFLIAAIGFGLAFLPDFINNLQDYMNKVGDFYAPIAGVIIGDILLVRFLARIDVPGLFDQRGRYRFIAGVNWVALAMIPIGYFINRYLTDNHPSILPAAVTVVIIACVYAAAMHLVARWVPVYREAISKHESDFTDDEINAVLLQRQIDAKGGGFDV